jgi:cation transport ATPase
MTNARQNRTSSRGTVRSLLFMGAVLFLVVVVAKASRKLISGVPPSQVLVHLTPWAFLWLLALLVFVPGFVLAERAAISRGRAAPYTLVVLVGSALVAAFAFAPLDWLGIPARAWLPPGSPVPREVASFLDVLLRMGLAAFIYAGHRERLEAAEALQALETRRNTVIGRLAASRLEAARTRVQPEVFIAELRALRRTYDEDPAAGGAGLEAIIARLRAFTRSVTP